MYPLQKCIHLLRSDFSVITVGTKKKPNFAWKKYQTEPIKESIFTRQYNYAGGLVTKKGTEITATTNVGFATGFDNLEVIDVDLKVLPDPKSQAILFEKLVKLIEKSWPDFQQKVVIALTINNGYHFLYKAKNCGRNKVLAQSENERTLIETRGAGGYVFLYDKFLNNKTYIDIQYITDFERDIMIEASKSFNQFFKEKETYTPQVTNEIRTINLTTKQDFNNRNSVWSLIQNEFELIESHADKLVIKRNGSENSSSGSIFTKSNILYLFTTSTKYPSEVGLNAFAVYAIQNHGGDEKSAWRDLYDKGYGDRWIKKAVETSEDPAIDIYENNFETKEFPVEVFPPLIQTYISELAVVNKLNIDYMACAMLWVASISIGNVYQLDVKKSSRWREKAIVWLALAGTKGAGKTHALKAIAWPLSELNVLEVNQFNKDSEMYNEYKALSAKEKNNLPEIQEPMPKQFIVNNTTVEGLFDLHKKNKRGVGVLADELTTWLNGMNQYKVNGADLAFWLDLFNGSEALATRKSSGTSAIEKSFVPVIGNVPTSVFTRIMAGENMDNGLFDRILICYPERTYEYVNEEDIAPALAFEYKEFIIALFQDINRVAKYDSFGNIQPHSCGFTKEANEVFWTCLNKFVDIEKSEAETELIKGLIPKIKTYLPRFALLLNCLSAYDKQSSFLEISKKSVLDAEKLCYYFLNNVRKFAQNSVQYTDIKTICEANKNKPTADKIKAIIKALPHSSMALIAKHVGVSNATVCRVKKTMETPKN